MDKKELEKLKLSNEELKAIAGGATYPDDSYEMMLARSYAKRIVQQHPAGSVEELAEMLDYVLGQHGINLDQDVREQLIREAKMSVWGFI